MRRIISVLLVVCVLCSLFVACSDLPTDGSLETGTSSSGSTPDSTGGSPDNTDTEGTSEPTETSSGTSQTGTSQTGTSQTGTSQTGTSQTGTSQTGTSQTGTSQNSGKTQVPGTSSGKTSNVSNKTSQPGPSSSVSNSDTQQNLKYWVNFPQKGTVKTVKAYKFTVSNSGTGVSITAYNKDGTKNSSSSVSFLDMSVCSYEITNNSGSVVKKGDCKSKDNGIPVIVLNVSASDANTLKNSNDKNIKENWYKGSYSYYEGTAKKASGNLQVKRRGFTSFDKPKKPYTLKLDTKTSLAGMNSNKDWILSANYSDKTLLRNFFAYTIAKKMNTSYVPDCRSVELYMNNGTSTEYLGTYLMAEKIEVAKDKINITEMTANDTSINGVKRTDSTSKILAGSFLVELETFDRFGKGDTGLSAANFQMNVKSPGKSLFKPVDGKWNYNEWGEYNTTTNKNLSNYIQSFFSVVDSAIINGYYSNSLTDIEKYIDVNSFVDYYIINELAKNVDGNLRLSSYFYKDKGGKMKITVWDFDIAFGNCDYGEDEWWNNCGEPTGFYIKERADWYYFLMNISGFRSKVKTRWNSLRSGILSNTNIASTINTEANKITKSAEANFNTWKIMGTKVWPNTDYIAYNCTTYKSNVNHMIDWIKTRAAWLDKNL